MSLCQNFISTCCYLRLWSLSFNFKVIRFPSITLNCHIIWFARLYLHFLYLWLHLRWQQLYGTCKTLYRRLCGWWFIFCLFFGTHPQDCMGPIELILKLNPYYYIVEGYRSALLGNMGWYLVEHLHYTIYFWAVTFLVFMIGAALHIKFRNSFVDFL